MIEHAYGCKVEWDEDGLHLIVDADEQHDFIIDDPELLYDTVKEQVGPWLYEMYQAKAEYDGNIRAGLKWSAQGWIDEEEEEL